MDEVAPNDLLRQMLDELELIAATPATQRAWLAEQDFPSDELMQQLDDSL